MSKRLLFLVIAALTMPAAVSAQVQLTSAIGPAHCIGSSIVIKWGYTAGPFESSPKVNIELKRGSGPAVRQIANVAAGSGQYSWTLPAGLALGSGYTIVLTAPSGPSGGAATTQFAINGPPQITNQPMSFALCEGTPYTLSVGATGVPVTSSQWRRNGSNIAGATGPTLSIVLSASTVGAYSVVLHSACGSVTSSTAQVTISAPSPISVTSGAKTLRIFTAQTLSTTPTFQWRRNGTAIAGQVGGTISVEPGAETAGTYSVVVSSPCVDPVTASDPSWVVVN